MAHASCMRMDQQRAQHPSHENGQDIRDRSFQFACRAVGFCEALYIAGGVGRMMVPQLVGCTTSVAAMLEEARAAESKRDFISKCNIGLKECRESRVRLRVCAERRYGPPNDADTLAAEAGELIAIITAIVRNTRRNMKQQPQPPRSRGRIRNS